MRNVFIYMIVFWGLGLSLDMALGQGAVIPEPISLTMGSGSVSITSENVIYYAEPELEEVATLLQGDMRLIHSLDLAVQAGSAGGEGDILLRLNPAVGSGGAYQLTVDTAIVLEARDIDGIFPGSVTILQAVEGVDGAKSIARMTIEDEPYRQFRAVMVDIKNQWHSVDDIKQIIRMCRFYKASYCSLHTGESQWIGAVMGQTAGIAAADRAARRLYTKAEMDDIIAYARSQGVRMMPHNESSRGFSGMKEAVSKDWNPSDAYANFMDEYDGQGAYDGDYNDSRYWGFIQEVTRRGMRQFAAGYRSGHLPYYHIGPVQGEGGMNRADAARIVGFITAEDSETRAMFWNGIDGGTTDALSAQKEHIVIAYYQQWGGSTISGYLNTGWQVVNAAWSPLYVVGSGVARTQEQVYVDWNMFRTGTDGFSNGGFDYNAIHWINFDNPATRGQVLGGMLCTWEVPLSIHMERLRLRVPAFMEHTWHHQSWPYPESKYPEFQERYGQTDEYLTRFLMSAEPPSTPQRICATDRVFADRIMVNWAAVSNNPTGYRLYRNSENNFDTAELIKTVSETEYVDFDIRATVRYYYWVRAYNAFGETGVSPVSSGQAGTSQLPARAYEPFSYEAGSGISGQGGGSGWRDSWVQTSFNGVCEVNDYGLSYGALPVAGRSIRIHPVSDTPSILFNRHSAGQMGIAGTSSWMSFLLGCNQQGVGHLFVGFNTINIGKRWGSQVAIENNSTSSNVKNGNTYFIVCQSVNFDGQDTIYLWVNPDLDRQPRSEDADLTLVKLDMTEADRVIVNNQGYGQGSYDIDEIRLGWQWQDVSGGVEADHTAPSPDPMTWVSPPVPDGEGAAAMACTEAEDPAGVEYYFEELSGHAGGADSG